jgi:hypothetical protein
MAAFLIAAFGAATGTFYLTRRAVARGEVELPESETEPVPVYALVGTLVFETPVPAHRIKRFSQACVAAIEENDGTIDRANDGKFSAFWTVDPDGAHDAEGPLAACVAIRERLKELNAGLRQDGMSEVKFTLSVHRGMVGPERALSDEVLLGATGIQELAQSLGADVLVAGEVVDHAPKWFRFERASSGDDEVPELHELVGSLEDELRKAA